MGYLHDYGHLYINTSVSNACSIYEVMGEQLYLDSTCVPIYIICDFCDLSLLFCTLYSIHITAWNNSIHNLSAYNYCWRMFVTVWCDCKAPYIIKCLTLKCEQTTVHAELNYSGTIGKSHKCYHIALWMTLFQHGT